MAQIVPTITVENAHVYREQVERVEGFARRIHIDLMDGVFTPNKSVAPEAAWWPEGMKADVHVMFQEPANAIEVLLKLSPKLIIIPAESEFDFAQLQKFRTESKAQFGVALLPETSIASVQGVLQQVDHLLIFSGNLGYQGGSVADLTLLEKVQQAKSINPNIEIGWDGGVNAENVRQLADAGVDIINSGGYIHRAPDPALAYHNLVKLLP